MHRKATLVLLSLVLVLVVLLGLGVAATVALGRTTQLGFARTIVVEDAAVNRIAGQIVHFDLPEGYTPEFGVRGMGFAMASYTPGDNLSHLMFIQIPTWLPMDEAAIIRQARDSQARAQQEDAELDLTIIEQREINLGDHTVFYAISEGTNDEGVAFRSLQVFYPTRTGKIALLFEEPIARWDDARVHALLASLR
jgi:hypothetical protein